MATGLLVSSGSGANGDGYGTVLTLDRRTTAWELFSEDRRITDPRGLCTHPSGELLHVNSGNDRILALDHQGRVARDTGPIDGLDPGGGVFGPVGDYCVGSRRLRTIMAVPASLDGPARPLLPPAIVPFPRGFAFGPEGQIFLASGIGPDGSGEETVKVFGPEGDLLAPALVDDPELSPLDMTIGPDGNIVVSSEWPFGAEQAISSVREYDGASGLLLRTFEAGPSTPFRNPRGLRFGPDGNLYCVARDAVVSFDYETGACLGTVGSVSRLFGQAIEFFG